jgi:bifunctional DNA primase/polymerase-like protein/uncharacterized protein DUF5906
MTNVTDHPQKNAPGREPERQNGERQNAKTLNSQDSKNGHAVKLSDIARGYLGRGWAVVLVPYKSKEPKGAWHKRTITVDTVELYFHGVPQNIGVQLGGKSKGLSDVDKDCAEAIRLAPYFLPETGAVFGRASKAKSHSLYKVSDAPDASTIKFADENGRCLIELRLGGGKKAAQTVFPGSVHESGELIEWEKEGIPAEVPFVQLERVVRSIAIASMLLRHWPTESGSRHDLALCIGGVMARAGYKPEDIPKFVEIVCREAGDSEFKDRAKAAGNSAEAFKKGDRKVWGRPKLGELLGKAVANAIGKLLPKNADEVGLVGSSLHDFYAYLPNHNYIYMPTRELWPASSVNSVLGKVALVGAEGEPIFDEEGNQVEQAASFWLDKNRCVKQMTWAPGHPPIIKNRLVLDGGWIDRQGDDCLNLYQPPNIIPGDASNAGPWIDHVRKVYPDDADHISKWCAHRVQRPLEKLNHALMLGGAPGVGKDSLLEPVKQSVGAWNFKEVSPQMLLGRFNGFVKSVILRVSEVRDLGELNRYQFYEHMKVYAAAPPDVLLCDEKHLREHSIFNCCGVVITSNYKIDGLYLPADDRRHYVAWTSLVKEDFDENYWGKLWGWYEHEDGYRHVAAYLQTLDISGFNAKAPPPKTRAFWDIVNANRPSEDAELADALDAL